MPVEPISLTAETGAPIPGGLRAIPGRGPFLSRTGSDFAQSVHFSQYPANTILASNYLGSNLLPNQG